MEIEAKIAALGLTLPVLNPWNFTRRVRVVRTGNLVYISGQLPLKDGEYPFKGPVPSAMSVEDAREITKYNALALLAALKEEIGDLDRVTRIVKIVAFVYADFGFDRASEVANGCSDLLMDLYGERGRHARSAIAVPGLALGTICETDMVAEVES